MRPHYGTPASPPPATFPLQPSPTSIVNCLHQYTYVWPKQGTPFWFYPTKVELGEVSGYKWMSMYWVPCKMDGKLIDGIAPTFVLPDQNKPRI